MKQADLNHIKTLAAPAFTRLVAVEWTDSFLTSGWTTEMESDHGAMGCVSVGWITQESEKALSVSPHISSSGEKQRNGTMTIPKCSIKRVVKLT